MEKENKKSKKIDETKVEETSKIEENVPEKKLEVKKETKLKIKKTEAKVNATSAPISTRHSVDLCKFIKMKDIEKAIKELEEVVSKRMALPMKGEFAHRKGKGMMSGKYPQNSTKYFIKLLKSLQSNANANEIKEPVIVEAVANLAPRPRGRFGRYQRKRTHITIVAKNKQKEKKKDIEVKK